MQSKHFPPTEGKISYPRSKVCVKCGRELCPAGWCVACKRRKDVRVVAGLVLGTSGAIVTTGTALFHTQDIGLFRLWLLFGLLIAGTAIALVIREIVNRRVGRKRGGP